MSKDKDREKDKAERTDGERELIRELAKLLNETGLTEIEIEKSGLKVRVARNVTASAAVAAPAALSSPASAPRPEAAPAAATADPASHPGVVKSPMVGAAYRAPEPGAPPFVEVGSKVTQGQTVLIIEAMKTMNSIPAPRSGTIAAVLIDNGAPVEFGQPLMIIE